MHASTDSAGRNDGGGRKRESWEEEEEEEGGGRKEKKEVMMDPYKAGVGRGLGTERGYGMVLV